MKDDIHELIDGELPDEQAAETLHLLSVDPEKRSAFRQQLTLQRTLYRNERHASLSSLEEGEMLERVMRSAGDAGGAASRFARRGVVMLALGFLVGSGAGYAGHSLLREPDVAVQPTPDTVRIMQPAEHIDTINRDSIVAAIRDSLRAAQKAAATSPRTTAKVAPKRGSRPSSTNDVTGHQEVRRNKRGGR